MIPSQSPNPLAPLEPLLSDPDVQEIMVDASDKVLVERHNQIVETDVKFASAEALRAAIDAALALGGAAFQPGETVCDTTLTDGTRVLGVLPPTAVSGPYMILRKFFTHKMTWEMLFGYGAITPEVHALLMEAIRAPVNVLVSGGTGAGKTTVQNLLAQSIPAEERIIVISNAELPVNHPRRIHLSPSSQTDLTSTDLINTAAKMRPDWVIFGELHGAETIHLLQLFGTGFNGIASIHGTSVENTLSRLEAMCLMANLGLGIVEIRQTIADAFGVITCQRLFPDGHRRITEVVELTGIENGRYLLQPLVRYNEEKGQFERTPIKASWEK
ncbi:MAG: CpaF family protein [Anaerolineales bacterium]|nr:CpaF family protein [Anaerolineales bacterium]